MNDKDSYRNVFDTRLRDRHYRYTPVWVHHHYYPSHGTPRPTPQSSVSSSGGQASPGGTTTFGDVAASFAGWTENTFGQMASAISPGSLQVPTKSGVVDLSGFDKASGDVFEALAESSSSGGGGGGSCACACAGCACACACAGGGR